MVAQELLIKANRAYYSMSSIFYQNKKMKVDRAFELFDSLITPIALYASQFWSVLTLPLSAFTSLENFLKSWEKFVPEVLNQKLCRLLLSVHKKTSRLAVLGELSRNPLLLTSIVQSLKYKWTLFNKTDKTSLVFKAVNEMNLYVESDTDCWLNRICKIEKMCNISRFPSFTKADKVKTTIKAKIQSVFDRFYLDQINEFKPNNADLLNHNKLRTYATLKGSFKREPYIDLVQSRNQRSWISRLRCSAHNLEVEKMRWSNVPAAECVCTVCHSGEVGDEFHFAMQCPVFNVKRACYFGKMSSILPRFKNLSIKDKFKTMLCPSVSAACKVTNQFLRIMFLARDKLAQGVDMSELTYPSLPVNNLEESFDIMSDVEDEWDQYFQELDITFLNL